MPSWQHNLVGRFLVVDGPDGAGKTTQLDRMQAFLESAGLPVCRAVDPGGTPTGQEIRNILLHSKDLAISPTCETLLFMASRAQLLAEVVRPALDANQVVLCDRYLSATLAYQGALGVDPEMILRLGEITVSETWPDLTILLDVSAEVGLGRVGQNRDRLESRDNDYHQRVRAGFATLETTGYPAPLTHIDATGTPDDVAAKIQSALEAHFHG